MPVALPNQWHQRTGAVAILTGTPIPFSGTRREVRTWPVHHHGHCGDRGEGSPKVK